MDGQTDTLGAALLPNRWDDAHAETLTPQERLLYRSNLLGADKRITNFGGGNTSSKFAMTDPVSKFLPMLPNIPFHSIPAIPSSCARMDCGVC